METAAQVKPSPEARSLFNRMVALASPVTDDGVLHIGLGETLGIGARRAREGQDARASREVHELSAEGWISPAPDGGWLIGYS